ncbi:hypothetical protein SDC9_168782 [bioreactor metagenome]|uniref:Uncharacterized protein n=1 Tax=bioreactor metagenome TaxID=1076179 RepID=A0A645GC10_9ZZZZ
METIEIASGGNTYGCQEVFGIAAAGDRAASARCVFNRGRCGLEPYDHRLGAVWRGLGAPCRHGDGAKEPLYAFAHGAGGGVYRQLSAR